MQAQEASTASKLLLYGCQMPWLPQDHNCIQPRADGGTMQGMFDHPLYPHWWQGQTQGWVLFQEEAALNASVRSLERIYIYIYIN